MQSAARNLLRRAAGMFPGGPLFLLALLIAVSTAAAPGPLRFADDAAPIEASLYSLSSGFFEPGEAARFLAAARHGAPGRRILVACDRAMCDALAARLGSGAITLLPASSAFSPWPRDPFLFARAGEGGGVVLVERPNTQPGREADAKLAEWLASSLPAAIGEPWGGVRVAVSPWPFHGGQLLQEGDRVWLTLHAVERRVLDLLGLDRVPVEAFGDPAAVGRYARAARQAADELAGMLGRRAVFVHPLPASASGETGPALFRHLGAAAGRDLDTYLTFLPRAGGATTALVGDLRAGGALAAASSPGSLEELRQVYDLAPRGEGLRRALLEAQRDDDGFADYLDLVATELARRGLTVRRLPLLRVPTALLNDRAGVAHRDFLLGWNNVVVERREGQLSAEGFASGWAPGDEAAVRLFGEGGAALRLLPPLAHSIVLGGGYRCASNHLRRAE